VPAFCAFSRAASQAKSSRTLLQEDTDQDKKITKDDHGPKRFVFDEKLKLKL
jgi:hypothetical protein